MSNTKTIVQKIEKTIEKTIEDDYGKEDIFKSYHSITIGNRYYLEKEIETLFDPKGGLSTRNEYVPLFKKVFQTVYPITRTSNGLPKKPRDERDFTIIKEGLTKRKADLQFEIKKEIQKKGDSVNLREKIKHLQDIIEIIDHFDETKITFPYDQLQLYIDDPTLAQSTDFEGDIAKIQLKEKENTRVRRLLRQFAKLYLEQELTSDFRLYDPGVSKEKFEKFLQTKLDKTVPTTLGNLIRFLYGDKSLLEQTPVDKTKEESLNEFIETPASELADDRPVDDRSASEPVDDISASEPVDDISADDRSASEIVSEIVSELADDKPASEIVSELAEGTNEPYRTVQQRQNAERVLEDFLQENNVDKNKLEHTPVVKTVGKDVELQKLTTLQNLLQKLKTFNKLQKLKQLTTLEDLPNSSTPPVSEPSLTSKELQMLKSLINDILDKKKILLPTNSTSIQRGGDLSTISMNIANNRFNNNFLEETNPFYHIIEDFNKTTKMNVFENANQDIMMSLFLDKFLNEYFQSDEMKEFYHQALTILNKKSCDTISNLCFRLLDTSHAILERNKNIDVVRLDDTSLNAEFDELETQIKEHEYDFFEHAKKQFPEKKELSIKFYKDHIYFYLETHKFDKMYSIDEKQELHLENYDYNDEIYYVNNHLLFLFYIICAKLHTNKKYDVLDSYVRKAKRSKTKRLSTLLKERKANTLDD